MRRAKLGQGGRDEVVHLETLFGTLQVSNPARPRSVTSRNRVMRESRGDAGREAFTGSGQAVGLSPERDRDVREPRPSVWSKATSPRRSDRRLGGLVGVCVHGMSTRGSPGTREGLSSPLSESRLGGRSPTPRPVGGAPLQTGANNGAGRYRQAKATKCGETGGGKSEYRVVPMKRGNPPRRRPRGGKAVPSHGPVVGNHVGVTELHGRVTATTADSDACRVRS